MNRRRDWWAYSERLFGWWADRPGVQAAVLIVMTLIALLGYYDPSIVRRLVGVAPIPPPYWERPQQRVTQRPQQSARSPNVRPFQVGGGECVVIATSPHFFTSTGLTAIRKAVEDLESLPQVDSVLWLDNVPGLNLFGLPESVLPHSQASERQMEKGRERALGNPLVVGQLISPDGETIVLHLRLDWFYVTSDEACTTELREAAERAVAQVPGAKIQFKVTGPAPLHLMMISSHMLDSIRYQLVGYSIMLISALVLFRGLSAVLIVAFSPAAGVFWTMGFLRYFNLQDNPFNDVIVPVLISLVGLTDSVHLMAEIRNQRATGLDPVQAARRGIARVGMACVLTCLSTAIGFICLLWAHHEVVREFGWCCVLGVGLTLISVLTVVPLGCRSWLGRGLHIGLGKSLVDGQLRRIEPVVAWILRHDRRMAWFAIAITTLLSITSLQLEPDERRYSGLGESGEAAQALRHMDRSLGGLEFGNVHISWNEQASDGELLEVLLAVDRILAAEPLIGHPLGLHQLLAALPGEGPADERMTLLELLPASLKRAFYNPEQQTATIQFRVQDIGIAKYGPVFERMESAFTRIRSLHPNFEFELGGEAVWRWRHVYRIVTDLTNSLGTAGIVIWLVMTIAYRSIRIGLISLVPNLFPLAATGTMLVLSGQYLELPTVCVFVICAGISVDDSIHFLTRYTEEQAAGGTHKEIIQRAFSGVGTAMLMTAIVLIAGMLTAVFGDARDARLFGIMGALTLFTALFGDILLLPALLSQFAPTPKPPEASDPCASNSEKE
jgi:predicted RND superfamily exporter protein